MNDAPSCVNAGTPEPWQTWQTPSVHRSGGPERTWSDSPNGDPEFTRRTVGFAPPTPTVRPAATNPQAPAPDAADQWWANYCGDQA